VTDLYSLKDVARLFGLQEARLRYWAQTGFVGPSVRRGPRAYYTFQDLIGVKVAKELLDGGITLQRVRRSLAALRDALPHVDRPLARLRICGDGDTIAFVDDEVAMDPKTGQLLLSFAVSSLTHQIAEVLALPVAGGGAEARAAEGTPTAPPTPAARRARETSYAAFLQGLAAEERGDEPAAEERYRRAVELDPSLAAAWTNLGNLQERRGARGAAREAWERALALDPEQPEARYNLANLLSDVGELELAMAEYRRVTASCPEFADAHFNLGLLCARVGSIAQAQSHLRRYLELDPESEWAGQARDFLASLR
jgi:tetratricopeptide (TPR) repeat protein